MSGLKGRVTGPSEGEGESQFAREDEDGEWRGCGLTIHVDVKVDATSVHERLETDNLRRRRRSDEVRNEEGESDSRRSCGRNG